jgi:hypothetical protein
LGGKIPSTIRRQVFKEWVEGYTRDQIAKRNQIGAATVSAIVNEGRQNTSDIDLVREMAVDLRKENLNVGDFASTMRLRNKMIEWGVAEDPKMEDFIERVNVHCFKAEISPEKFIEMVHNVTSITDQFKSSVVEVPSKILKLQKKLKSYKKRVKRNRDMKETLLSAYLVTEENLEDYINKRPLLIEENTRLKNIIKAHEEDARALRKINDQQFRELFEYRYKEMISENELRKLDQSWPAHEPRLSVKELHEIAHEMYHNPSKYIDIIRRIRAGRVQSAAA